MSLYPFQLYILNSRSIFPFFKIKRHPTKDTSKPLGLFELNFVNFQLHTAYTLYSHLYKYFLYYFIFQIFCIYSVLILKSL